MVRKDLLQLLIQLRNTGNISEDANETWHIETSADKQKAMSIGVIAANLFLFYIAGSETTSSTIAYTLYELAMYPDILQRVQNEIIQCLQKHDLRTDGHLTYEAVHDMPYLDMCINGK